MIVDFSAIETTLELICIIPFFQPVLLIEFWSSGSQVIALGTQGSKQIYQQTKET
jgi:hypothetical protein